MSIQIAMMLPPEAASVPMARRTLAEALSMAGVAPDCIDEAKVALSEACTNVYRHVEADHSFEVLINVGEVHLTMHIMDAGPGFARSHQVPDWPDHAAENGRGLALMTAFTDDASFESHGGGGSVRLRKRLCFRAPTAMSRLA
jgi:serine/threonine-protein kinase RsbW